MLAGHNRMTRLQARPGAALVDRRHDRAEPACMPLRMQQIDKHRRPSGRVLSVHRRMYRLHALVPLGSWDIWLEVLQGISETRVVNHHALVVRLLERVAKRERLFRSSPIPGETDGVVVVGLSPTADLLQWVTRLDVPAVLLDGQHPKVSSVVLDHEAAAAKAVRHLLALGHKRIAFVDYLDDQCTPESSACARRRGYRTALAQAGLVPRLGYERAGDGSAEVGRAAAEAWLALPEPPTAVFAGSDRQALGVLDGVCGRGLRVPADLAVVGYGDMWPAAYLGLTTVRVPMQAMGKRAVELLADALRGRQCEPVHVRMPLELVVRRTCGSAS